jgi:two-component system cell cycle response regulator
LALALTDSLTGLYNRRYLQAHLEGLLERVGEGAKGPALLLFDVDWFKRVNDGHGHPAGDAVLKEVTARVSRHVRGFDLVARYGGEEFVVVLPATDASTARVICERIVTAFQNTGHSIGSEHAKVTISIGCATHGGELAFPNVSEFVKAADQALYTAKLRGRNRSVPFDRQLPSVLATAARPIPARA